MALGQHRAWCAAALLSFAACSFPEFRVPEQDGAGGSALPSCNDGVRNGYEDELDCGGSQCRPCPVCKNGRLDAGETGIDCGGSQCEACPSCDDQRQNGTESDVDCGGNCAKRCATDQRCAESADCGSLVCSSRGVCEPSNCQDNVRNGGETGVDCGGSCAGCKNGAACLVNDDCDSVRCQDAVCVNAGCSDGIVNGHESDKDCGGDCAPCAAAAVCKENADCQSQLCSSGEHTCKAPSCSDSTKNQAESGVDCGGANCSPCPEGQGCEAPADCSSALCQNGTCVPENPKGQPLSKSKWKLKSSEPNTEMGLSEPFDGTPITNWTSGTAQRTGMYVDVDLGEPLIFFEILLQTTEAPYDQDYPSRIDVYVSNDGTFGAPARPGIQGSQWTWVHFTGAQVARYLRFQVTQTSPHPWSLGEINLYN